MRIHRVSLRDFRGVGSADVRFAPEGVTVVQGPNEAGKSSIADAIDMLLTDPDSSTRARVKAARPVGRDVGPRVEMEFETGPYRLVYAKQWLRSPTTELRVEEPEPQQLAGREAHDRVAEILDRTMDAALFAALRHQQGMPLDQAELGSSTSLARALDLAAGGGGVGQEDAALVEAVDAERLRWITPGGAPNAALVRLGEAADAARARAGECTARLRDVEERIDEHRRLEAEIRAGREREPDLVRQAERCDAALAAVTARQAEVDRLDRLAEAAEATARAAGQALAAREGLVRAVAHGERDMAELDARCEAAAAAVQAAGAAAADAAEQVAAAGRAVRAADDARGRAAQAAAHLRDAFDLEFLVQRRDTVAEADARITQAEEFLAGCAIDPDLLQAIEDAAVDEAVAAGRLRDSAAPLRLEAEASLGVEWGDGAQQVPAGGEVDIDLLPGDALRVPGVARISLRADAAAARADARAAAGRLADLLARAGVPAGQGVSGARSLERERLHHQRVADDARQARQRALYDLTPEEMDAKIARARDRTGARAPDDGTMPAPASVDEANARVAQCDAARDDARRDENLARRRQQQADAALAAARAEHSGHDGQRRAVASRVRDDREALDLARAEECDDALRRAADAATHEARDARARHRDESEALAGDDPDVLADLARNAHAALERLRDERESMQLAAERLLGEIGRSGEEGLADRAAEADEAARLAEQELAAAEREAAAASLLHEVLTRHLDQARRAYVGPFRDGIERLARMVFGPGTTVEVDHATLRVTSRTRDGITVPYGALSGGAREQLAVIGRLAAAALASADGGAPVIIDDAMGYSDPARLQGLGAALAAAGRDAQVIVLTCTPDRQVGIGAAHVVRLQPSREGPSSPQAGDQVA